ncbi:MAG: hypothetical protein KDA21_12545 [Phycisphaerales bacterium]|nr:hypothetical protein [Phycisphaerales bacterium]
MLEALGIPYFTTGSMASTLYGEPRFTNDVDVVIRLPAGDVMPLCAAFPGPEFYVSPEAARDAARHATQFNVIHPGSGLKVDFMVAEETEFNRSRFQRVRPVVIAPGVTVNFASPEDVILRKLQYFQEGGSEKHLRDIRGILRLCEPPIDDAYVRVWARTLGVEEEWARARG